VLPLSCPYGVIGEIVDFGVNDVASHVKDPVVLDKESNKTAFDSQLCLNINGVNNECKPNNPKIEPALDKAIGQ